MADLPRLWMRHEVRPTERRAPIVPEDAARLIDQGVRLTVEESPQRVFPIQEYADAGCRIAPTGGWIGAPGDEIVVGLKELPDQPGELAHQHVFFGHAYKGQDGARELLSRFAAGGGALLDIEYLVGDDGRRLAAFGYWAGYVGAALAVLHYRRALIAPLVPWSKDALDDELRRGADGGQSAGQVGTQTGAQAGVQAGQQPRALVIGALGRCGQGARDALAVAGLAPTCWDVAETRELDHAALLGHDILVNAVLSTRPIPPFVTPADLEEPGRNLSVIADVTCDVGSECNVLPIYQQVTSWEDPVDRLRAAGRSPGRGLPLDLIAIDNLPSLLPKESSVAFSAELAPQLSVLGSGAAAWQRCLQTFHESCRATGIEAAHPANTTETEPIYV
jgi:saccharopine dehydrogenase (NAD+, L-lysine forming)